MEANQVSLTAMGTAFMRAYHSAHDHPKIFDDFMAHRLITKTELKESEERHLRAFQIFDPDRAAAYSDRRQALAYWMQNAGAPAIVLSRARYAEDLLEQAVRHREVQQYVILGAGMDTFGLRRPDLLERLRLFEVDHPGTQAHKRRRLRKLGRKLPGGLQFIPVDFSQESLATALLGAGYDPQAPSFFSWCGVTYYLSREALEGTFSAIAEIAPPGSSMIFDYLHTDAFVPEKVARRVQFMMEIVRRVGEPMLTGFEPAALAADLGRFGLEVQEDLTPADIQRRFFEGRPDGYHACEHAHFVRVRVG